MNSTVIIPAKPILKRFEKSDPRHRAGVFRPLPVVRRDFIGIKVIVRSSRDNQFLIFLIVPEAQMRRVAQQPNHTAREENSPAFHANADGEPIRCHRYPPVSFEYPHTAGA